MYVLNKIVGCIFSPIGFGLLLLACGIALCARGGKLKRYGIGALVLSFGWFSIAMHFKDKHPPLDYTQDSHH